MRSFRFFTLPALALIGCTGAWCGTSVQAQAQEPEPEPEPPFQVEALGQFNEPWAMAFLPSGQALITEKIGALKLWSPGGEAVDVAGVPAVGSGDQGGLGDVVLHPDFARNNLVYLSWAEAGPGDTRCAAVGRARLVFEDGAPRLEGMQVIWRQRPDFEGQGHHGHRLAFSPDGRHLFISSGERRHFGPAEQMNGMGKILRLNPDGSVPADNPFADRGGVMAQVWTLGHRNPLGVAFDPDGRLWEVEMGPQGGDEMNLIVRGSNYGYPVVSNGDHHDGRTIPDHDTRPEFAAPSAWWTPAISPGAMIVYTGNLFPQWRGDAIIAGLSSHALVRVDIDGGNAREVARYPMGHRVREVEQGPDGSVYLLEDTRRGNGGRLLRLTRR